MTVVIIGLDERVAIDELVAEARANFIPWEVLERHALDMSHEGPVTLADIKSKPKRPEPRHIMVGSVECAFSFEQQPAGLCRHLSLAVLRKGKLPHPAAVEMIAEAFGFTRFPPQAGRVWVEEYEAGRHAVNIVELAEPAAGGHA